MTAQRNPPVDNGSSSSSDDCANNPVGMTNEPVRESGSLKRTRRFQRCIFYNVTLNNTSSLKISDQLLAYHCICANLCAVDNLKADKPKSDNIQCSAFLNG
ncbi:nucleolar MIF4G domain-containing protein 1 [Trichinella spiralis]|uniref:nucleolar MIF4G domain-containing protein 1 n=1 Tax=Trichinella spiralis TaxID=6334 RepID=UPI0001EFC078|nr:nucleolar MIF4G domain-containing protein 1 [Trichinella spiralis]